MATKVSKIEWCCLQKNGIKLIQPNPVLGRSYLECADYNLNELKSPALKTQNAAAYLACYNSFYSILQKIGIKCELRQCIFEFFSLIPGFTSQQINLANGLQKTKIEIEQHIKKPKKVNREPIEDFVATCKQVFDSLSNNVIQKVRKEITKTTEKNKLKKKR